jgi:NADPH-dependent ferric siderophore reductase
LTRPFPYATGLAEVRAVQRLTPRMARIAFGGDALAGFPDEEPGEIITFIWPAAGAEEIVLPERGWRFPPGTPEQHARNYTVRAYDPAGPSLVVDFVLHGDHGQATRWATSAAPGDVLGFAGPRVHWTTDRAATWTLLAGDETALPAIAATLERLPAGHPAFAFVEIAGAAERLDLRTEADLRLTWLHRDGDEAGRSRRLEAAIRAAELPGNGRPKVWVAGESLAVRGIREHVRDERGLPIGPMQAIGYWKHRETPEDVE